MKVSPYTQQQIAASMGLTPREAIAREMALKELMSADAIRDFLAGGDPAKEKLEKLTELANDEREKRWAAEDSMRAYTRQKEVQRQLEMILELDGCDHQAGWDNGTIYHEQHWAEDPFKDPINLREGAAGGGIWGSDAWRITVHWHLVTCKKMSEEEAKKKLVGLTFKKEDSYGHLTPQTKTAPQGGRSSVSGWLPGGLRTLPPGMVSYEWDNDWEAQVHRRVVKSNWNWLRSGAYSAPAARSRSVYRPQAQGTSTLLPSPA